MHMPESRLRQLAMPLILATSLPLLTMLPGCYQDASNEPDPIQAAAQEKQQAAENTISGGVSEAKRRLPEFKAAVESRDPRYSRYFVCCRQYNPDGTNYLVWYSDVTLSPYTWQGKAYNPPPQANLPHGSPMGRPHDEILDWMMVGKDNKVTGGWTLRIDRSRMTPEERAAFDSKWKLKFD